MELEPLRLAVAAEAGAVVGFLLERESGAVVEPVAELPLPQHSEETGFAGREAGLDPRFGGDGREQARLLVLEAAAGVPDGVRLGGAGGPVLVGVFLVERGDALAVRAGEAVEDGDRLEPVLHRDAGEMGREAAPRPVRLDGAGEVAAAVAQRPEQAGGLEARPAVGAVVPELRRERLLHRLGDAGLGEERVVVRLRILADRREQRPVPERDRGVVAVRRERGLREAAQARVAPAPARIVEPAVGDPRLAVVDLRRERAAEPLVLVRPRASAARDGDHVLRRLGELRMQAPGLLERGLRLLQMAAEALPSLFRDGARPAAPAVVPAAVDLEPALDHEREPGIGAGRRERLAQRFVLDLQELREDLVDRARLLRAPGAGLRPRDGGRAQGGGVLIRRIQHVSGVGGEETLEGRALGGGLLQLGELLPRAVVPVPLVLADDRHPREERILRALLHREVVGAAPVGVRAVRQVVEPGEPQLALHVLLRLADPLRVLVRPGEKRLQRLAAQERQQLLVAEARGREEVRVRADEVAPRRERGLAAKPRPLARRGRLPAAAGAGRRRVVVEDRDRAGAVGVDRERRVPRRLHEPGRVLGKEREALGRGERVRRAVAVEVDVDGVRAARELPDVHRGVEARDERRAVAARGDLGAVGPAQPREVFVFAGHVDRADRIVGVVAELGPRRRGGEGEEGEEEEGEAFHCVFPFVAGSGGLSTNSQCPPIGNAINDNAN